MSSADPFAAVPAPLRASLMERGFAELTPVQQAVLAADSEGRDLRISSKTGSGKTVALGLALARSLMAAQCRDEAAASTGEAKARTDPKALVITPTRELAVQVRDELRWLMAQIPGARVDAVTGGTDVGGDKRMLRRPPMILVGTPGRLGDHLRSGALRCDRVEHVVLDEADRMLDMGFREELEAIIDTLPAQRRSHLVSATFGGQIRKVADRFQTDALHLQGSALGEANEDIVHLAQLVEHTDRYAALVNALLIRPGERVLVFVERRDGAAELAEQLAGDGFGALPFSGDLSQAQRTRTLHAFRTATVNVLVSTDVAARGIDVPDIAMVVHMTPPSDRDGYTHRSGRTGRAGQQGTSLLLVPPRAQRYVRRMMDAAKIDLQWQPVPTPARVLRTNTKRVRKELFARLDGETPLPDKTLEYVKTLLEQRDAVQVVGTLLHMAEPPLPRSPMRVQTITVSPPGESDPNDPDEGGPRPRRRGPPQRRRGPARVRTHRKGSRKPPAGD